MTMTIIFFMLYCNGQASMIHFFTLYHKRASDAMTITQPSRDARMQQSNIVYAVSHKDDSNKHCLSQGWQQCAYLFTLYCKEWQWQTMVDCNKGMWDHTMQEPAKSLCHIVGVSNNHRTATLLMQWSCPTLCCKRLWQQQWRLIARSTRDHTSSNQPFHWCGSITLAIAKAWGTSNNNCSRRHDTTLMTRQSFFIVILQGATTIKQQMQGKNVMTPTQQSNIHVVVCTTPG